MAVLQLNSWSTTPANNATVGSINFAEGQAPSTVNDSARQLMADVAAFYAALLTWKRSYLSGLTLSTAGSSATMSIAAGVAADSTSAALMVLAAFSKTTSAWAVGTGNGGKMSAAALAAGTYHFYLIQRVDTGLVDVGFDTSATAPTMPTNYTLFRRIGSAKNDGTNWVSFIQDGDLFQWLVPLNDIQVSNPGTAAVTRTLTVPTGINVIWVGAAALQIDVTVPYGLITDLATTDTAPTSNIAQLMSASANRAWVWMQVRTNTSAQVRSRLSVSEANTGLNMMTVGWIDRRGRDS